jgi:hypothetical protein
MISKWLIFGPALLVAGSLPAADWPQWRGPERSGHALAGAAVPATLPVEPKVVWRIKIGDGLASPVVADGRAFYLDHQAGKETVHAVDAATGTALWSATLDEAFKDSQSAPGPRCTPLVEGGRLYAQSCRGELQCLDAKDGRLHWRVSYVTNFGAVFIGDVFHHLLQVYYPHAVTGLFERSGYVQKPHRRQGQPDGGKNTGRRRIYQEDPHRVSSLTRFSGSAPPQNSFSHAWSAISA